MIGKAKDSQAKKLPAELPLCVDLDGTLVKTDLLWESLIKLLKQAPWCMLWLPFWLLQGKSRFKQEIADRVDLEVASLPYHSEFLSYLKEQERPLILATASCEKYALEIAKYLPIFDQVISTKPGQNLSGSNKLRRIREVVGPHFGYAGNAHVDCQIWDHCDEVIMVNPPKSLVKKYAAKGETKLFQDQKNYGKVLLTQIRIHQWAKNFLLFIPLLLAHMLTLEQVIPTVFAFFSFSVCASAVYLLNDLLDLESDRCHERKKNRPLASGHLPIAHGVFLIPLLLLISGGIALSLPLLFQVSLLVYFIMTLAYSFRLKSLMLIDVITLAMLYTIRIITGGFAAGVEVSTWLITFSLFFFFSLALAKRYSELNKVRSKNQISAKGRGYFASDLDQISNFGSSSGMISVIVMALYINSDNVTRYYRHPYFLWLICPVLLYWICRVWMLAHRDELHEDPVIFAITDWQSYIVGAVIGLTALAAILF
ncbi:MAG: hypothetical protein COB67_12815 [SAR324 cluster bacterium]|uniref:UbiA family prenyltransferase n=1 Tax=SAR324 cluster bacterium TaxID=2024889 RepID=A0A2A4SQ75_9DELT|nr:MAG: hypothetical protein COB67_12815 [SAR324 cluster bacterium]